MNLETQYLGLKLKNPLVIGASPFCDNTLVVRQLEHAGAAAIVMRSLFEEQIDLEQRALAHHVETVAESHAESTSYFPAYPEYQLAPDEYLRQLEHLKLILTIPVIASLNGRRPGGWTDYARRFEAAGADAIELNLYQLTTSPSVSADEVEADMLRTVRSVTAAVKIPVAVKLSPFHTALAQFVREVEAAGAAGVVFFNRFFEPDFNLEQLETRAVLNLSRPSELALRLRWLAILSPHLRGSLAASGGIHSTPDILKSILAGAHAAQLVSVVLQKGPQIITTMLEELQAWLEERGYETIAQARGAMNLHRCPDPAAYERTNYIRMLQSWQV